MLPKKLIGVRVGKRPFNLPSLGSHREQFWGMDACQSWWQMAQLRDFPSGPVVKTSSSNAGGGDSISGQRTKIPHVLQSKDQNIK